MYKLYFSIGSRGSSCDTVPIPDCNYDLRQFKFIDHELILHLCVKDENYVPIHNAHHYFSLRNCNSREEVVFSTTGTYNET